jgi:hypothetical protein
VFVGEYAAGTEFVLFVGVLDLLARSRCSVRILAVQRVAEKSKSEIKQKE